MLWRPYTFVVVIVSGLILALMFNHYRYQTVKQNYHTLKQQYHAQIETAKLQQQKIDALRHIDIQHTEELTDAKAKIDKLDDAVRAGNKRLRVNASCRESNAHTAKSRYDATTTQLSETVRKDYFRLREMMVENKKQTEYLQQYIKTQCQCIGHWRLKS